MSNAAKADDGYRAPLSQIADDDVLHFLSRTLKAHVLDAEPHGMLEKLHNLTIALEQQQSALAAWPDSPSKARICAALTKARSAVAKTVKDIEAMAPRSCNNGRANIRSAKAM